MAKTQDPGVFHNSLSIHKKPWLQAKVPVYPSHMAAICVCVQVCRVVSRRSSKLGLARIQTHHMSIGIKRKCTRGHREGRGVTTSDGSIRRDDHLDNACILHIHRGILHHPEPFILKVAHFQADVFGE